MKWVYWIIGSLLVIGLINNISGGGQNELTLVESNRPEQQRQFITLAQKAVTDWKEETGNDLARRKALYDALATRNKGFCNLFVFSETENSPLTMKIAKVKDWTGYVDTVAYSGSRGVLSVKLHAQSTTWNNNIRLRTRNPAERDSVFRSKIRPESAVYETALTLTEGDEISFSGAFYYNGKEECIKEAGSGLEGNAKDPEFIFRFDDIEKLIPQQISKQQQASEPPIQGKSK